MKDLRSLPAPVRERIAQGLGADFLDTRHRGFDITYRGLTLEHRATRRVELRADDDTAPPRIVGYAAVYDQPYEVLGGPPFGWSETIVSGAAAKSVSEQDDVFLFFDHEGMPLARTTSGTLRLESDRVGLFSDADVDPRSAYSLEIVHRLERGDLDAMSFAFQATRQEWNEDYTERTIREVRLFDVSVVSFPANPATVAMTRDADPAPRATSTGMSVALARAIADTLRVGTPA